MIKFSFILGTRPEAIKLAPVIMSFKSDRQFTAEVCVSGQHKQLMHQTLSVFDITPEHDLDLMQNNQSLAGYTSRAIKAIDDYLERSRPAAVIVQGDTSTVLAASISSFYRKIPVFHVEAGLRTYEKYSPFPEEMNRTVVAKVADLHFAPTQSAVNNLIREGVKPETVYLTGNTAIDSLLYISEGLKKDNLEAVYKFVGIPSQYTRNKKVVLITAHRRENFGEPFRNLCSAILTLANTYSDYLFVYPVHPNPNVKQPVMEKLGSQDNILLIDPLNYIEFVAMMKLAYIIMSDSGGVQEEAPSLNKPILILRDDTERPEGLEAGCALLVGTNPDRIIASFGKLITDKSVYDKMAQAPNPYGDGKASGRILDAVRGCFA